MFQLPREVKEDIENYKRFLEDFQSGRISADRFKGIRVPWGVYSHREGKVFMTRIRIPAGIVTSSQLKALAEASRNYGDGILHITTRQDIQIHNVKIEDTLKVMEFLKEYDLCPRGGGGNSVRNVIGCVFSGICKDEVFDVRRYSIALSEHLLRQDESFSLPRKFKVSFSGCPKDCAGLLINDLGFLAKYQEGKRGFKVFVGGGMGAQSRLGKLLEEFIPEEDLGYCVTAVRNVFNKTGDRRDKHHNRLRFLIEDKGLDKFKELYKREFSDLKREEHISLRKIDFTSIKEEDSEIPATQEQDYNEFLRYNVSSQKQNGFSVIKLRIPQGDISSHKLESLANLIQEFNSIEFRTSQNQNLFIAWVSNKDIHNIFLRLKKILNDFIYSDTLLDVVACKGALTCNLGLCNSPALSKQIEELVKKEFIGKRVFNRLEIKLNGCQNACGQQPIGKLAFHGMVRRVDNRPVPFYKFLLGGRREAEKTKFAQEMGMIPAKNITKFLREFLNKAESLIGDNQDIYEFLENQARDITKEILDNYSFVPSYSEDRDFYIDWGRKEDFSLAGLGPGECGAGILDMIEADLADAKISLEEAEANEYLPETIKKVLFLSARALLVIKGSDPKTDLEIFLDFNNKLINNGIVSKGYSNIKDVYEGISGKLSLSERKEKFIYAKKMFEHIDSLYKSMDSTFNFPKKEENKIEEIGKVAVPVMDLRGTPCPINYVKVKLKLETLGSGETLEVLLDEGEPIKNVPKSLEDDGHRIIKKEKNDDCYKIVVKKK